MASHQDDITIAVMGNTGTGKSSFIKLLSGDETVKIGERIDSETSEIRAVPFRDPDSDRRVTIVDTPGFDDSREGVTDTDILKGIAEFLVEQYDQDRKLNGLIYLSRISDPRFGGQSRRNLRMFRSLCGSEAYQNVVVLTTFWDKTSITEGEERESQLKTSVFKDLVEGGARFMRHDRTPGSAREVLRHILTLVPTNVQIQEEIRVEGKAFEDTTAGSVRREEVDRMVAEHNKQMEKLKGELEAVKEGNNTLRRELEEERAETEQKLARLMMESEELKISLFEADAARKREQEDMIDLMQEMQLQLDHDTKKREEEHKKRLQEAEDRWKVEVKKLERENNELHRGHRLEQQGLIDDLKMERTKAVQALQAQFEAEKRALEAEHKRKEQQELRQAQLAFEREKRRCEQEMYNKGVAAGQQQEQDRRKNTPLRKLWTRLAR